MDNKKAKERYEELKGVIAYHANKYYNEDEPEISDFEYDMLMLELKNIEKKHPELITNDSPTQVIVATGKVDTHFTEVKHEVPLQSLQDVFNIGDVNDFVNRIEKTVEKVEYVVEAKIDGLSVSLEYVNGKFVRGATRGDGLVGEDVTLNLKTIKSIPEKLTENVTVTVRGEVFLSRENFEKINEEREILGEKLFANPRNAAAGSLRQLDPAITAQRNLDIFIFNMQKIESKEITSHYESLQYLKKLGFNVSPYTTKCNNIEEIVKEIERDELEDKFSQWLIETGILYDGDSAMEVAFIGPKDMRLAQQLICGGSEHRKFLRQITVSVDITAPLYWWKEFDTYKVGTTANSTSTMHKITSKPITLDCFEIDDMSDLYELDSEYNMGKLVDEDENFRPVWTYDDARSFPHEIVAYCEDLRQKYLKTKDIRYWKELIRWLPESWLQTRTVTMNYENLLAICKQRRYHKLNEWTGAHTPVAYSFLQFARELPYAMEFIFIDELNTEKLPVIDF